MECKCYIKEEDGVEPQIIKCSLCRSALDLYEACKATYEELKAYGSEAPNTMGKLRQAIEKAKGTIE